VIPHSWKEGLVLPILKPGKDPASVQSYRPITLLSCMAKLMERLVARRLDYIVEKQGLLSPSQCGFRPGKSTMDALYCLEHHIRQALDSGNICIVIHVDLKSAFDKV